MKKKKTKAKKNRSKKRQKKVQQDLIQRKAIEIESPVSLKDRLRGVISMDRTACV